MANWMTRLVAMSDVFPPYLPQTRSIQRSRYKISAIWVSMHVRVHMHVCALYFPSMSGIKNMRFQKTSLVTANVRCTASLFYLFGWRLWVYVCVCVCVFRSPWSSRSLANFGCAFVCACVWKGSRDIPPFILFIAVQWSKTSIFKDFGWTYRRKYEDACKNAL